MKDKEGKNWIDKKIEILVTHDLNNGGKIELGADKNSKLYVNGEQVVTQKIIKVKGFELFLAIVIAVATATQAVFAASTFFKC